MTGCDPALVCTRLAVSLGTAGCGEQATLNSPPVIRSVDAFRISPGVGDVQTLTAQAYDPDGDQLYYEWDLDGDGEFERGGYTSTASHRYTSPGTVTVHLRVSDFPALPGGEGQATASKHFRVHTLAQFRRDHPPTASFTIAPNPVDRGAPLTLDGSASHDPDGDPLIYEWVYK